jgi:hypothetical protein
LALARDQERRFIAHPVRTEEPDKFPEDTPNRQDQRLRNQGDLFKPVSNVDEIKYLYAWLYYKCTNNGALAHIGWGMPAAAEDEWLARINLMNSPSSLIEPSKPVQLDPKSVMSFKETVADNVTKTDKA